MRRVYLVLIWFLVLAVCVPMASGRATAPLASDSVPAAALAGGAQVAALSAYFPIGVFEDGNITAGNLAKFATMIGDLQAHNLDSVMFTNNYAGLDAPLLGVSDRLRINVFMLPSGDLNTLWWPASVSFVQSAPTSTSAPLYVDHLETVSPHDMAESGVPLR